MFKSEGSHLFQIIHNKIKYDCDVSEDDGYYEEEFRYASMTDIPELKLRKGSKLELVYDFGDNYELDIKVIEIKKINQWHHLMI